MTIVPFPAVLAAAASGDEQAFALLWRDLQPSLLRYLHVVAPGWTEDLASDTWLEVVRNLHRFRGEEEGFRAWVFTIARHRAIDLRRRERRRRTDPVPTDLLAGWDAPDDPAGAALESVSTLAALALIAELTPDQAEVVALRVVAGLDVKHVAAVVGKRPGTVRVLSHRGLRRLASKLDGAARPLGRAPA